MGRSHRPTLIVCIIGVACAKQPNFQPRPMHAPFARNSCIWPADTHSLSRSRAVPINPSPIRQSTEWSLGHPEGICFCFVIACPPQGSRKGSREPGLGQAQIPHFTDTIYTCNVHNINHLHAVHVGASNTVFVPMHREGEAPLFSLSCHAPVTLRSLSIATLLLFPYSFLNAGRRHPWHPIRLNAGDSRYR